MHALEKILAAHAGVASVKTGEILNCEVDIAGINDLYYQTIRSFHEMGGTKVHDPTRIMMFMDHYAPASSITQAENQKRFREFCREQGIAALMDIDQGVCHQVLADKGFSAPGRIIVVTDSHTTTHGAFGAFGTGVGATDLAIILLTGQLWFRVPEIIRLEFEGELPSGVYAKDMILHAIGQLGADYGVYRGVELAGSTIDRLGISERMTLCNMTTELGAKTSYIQPDAVTLKHLKGRTTGPYRVFITDPGYEYAAIHRFDVSSLKPQLAAPSSVDNVKDLAEFVGTRIDQAYLGSCTGGRLEDLAVAAAIMKGRNVKTGTRFLVVPASKAVFLEAMERGYIQDLVQAGATFVTPGCAACLGTHEGMLAAGETCISATNRNFPGRMGHTEGRIFLGSPAAVAVAALLGEIADPRPYLS
jgi:3-isopropylmalate/(R)-2-methylmalate dehydratase large subunit